MNMPTTMIAIPGSERPVVPEARLLGKSDPLQRIKVSVYARLNPHVPAKPLQSVDDLGAQLPGARHYPTDEEFNAAYGADPEDLHKIEAYARNGGLTVLESSIPKRRVVVEGSVEDISNAFGVVLNEYEHPTTGRYRGREGQIHVPASLYGVVDGVFGLDTRHVGRSRLFRGRTVPVRWNQLPGPIAAMGEAQLTPARAATAPPWPGTFFPTDVARLYGYPADADGTGENIAIFAFNGDFAGSGGYSSAALKAYFEQVLGGKSPSITDVVVHGRGNDPGPDSPASERQGDSTGEIMLDLCVVGSVAPAARIFVYFTVFTSQGWVDGLHDAIMSANKVSVISISYGNPEDDPQGAWTKMGVTVVNAAFKAAAAKGITVCCASGDDGSTDQSSDGRAHVDFPASSPFVLGVGGTRLVSSGGANPTIAQETVWNDLVRGNGAGGGGISNFFSKPSYQQGANVPPSANPPHRIGRGVPDVAALADPETGVVVMRIDGLHLEPIGGTSASAPLWSALVARLNQKLKVSCGFLNPLLYKKFQSGVLRDITVGDNGAYVAGPGWDACTGFGSPQGQRLLQALSGPPSTTSVVEVMPRSREGAGKS